VGRRAKHFSPSANEEVAIGGLAKPPAFLQTATVLENVRVLTAAANDDCRTDAIPAASQPIPK
jgi:hypothetical protein